MGELDDWTPVAPCAAYVKEAKAAGEDIELTVYPGVYHVFDNPGLPSPAVVLDGAATWRECTGIVENQDGVIVNSAGQVFDYEKDTCVVKAGTHFGYDAAAHAKSKEDVAAFLAETLGMPVVK